MFGVHSTPLKISEITSTPTEREKELLRQIEELTAGRDKKPPSFAAVVSSGSAIRRTVPRWADNPEKATNIFQELHASGKFVIPTASQDTNMVDKTG